MTKSELLNFMKTDPVFKVADKQVVATLYESPFDNVVFDEETGETILELHGETFTFEQDDQDLAALLEENPYLGLVMIAKRVIISAGFIEGDDGYIIYANDTDITENALVPFPAPEDEGGDGGDGGDDGGNA